MGNKIKIENIDFAVFSRLDSKKYYSMFQIQGPQNTGESRIQKDPEYRGSIYRRIQNSGGSRKQEDPEYRRLNIQEDPKYRRM